MNGYSPLGGTEPGLQVIWHFSLFSQLLTSVTGYASPLPSREVVPQDKAQQKTRTFNEHLGAYLPLWK
jgi:hypothetical protein